MNMLEVPSTHAPVQARTEAKGSVRALYGTDGGKNAAHGRYAPLPVHLAGLA